MKWKKILWRGPIVFILLGLMLFSACTNPPENPPLEEAIKFCEEDYKGTVKERETHGGQTYYCLLPNGNECEINALYKGVCLNYPGKE